MARLTVLCGGLGGSRFADALVRAAGADAVTVVGNVGDDLEVHGLHVSPDLDTVLYTLAGLLDEERGWGVRDETYNARETAGRLGAETWFTLGDRDLGLHLVRTELLRAGVPLSAVFARLAERLGVGIRLLPASDEPVRTMLTTPDGELDFQTWFVRRRHADDVLAVRYEGAAEARPAPGALEAIAEADVCFLAPSNPFVSIGPILAVPGIADAIANGPAPVVGISPIIGGAPVKGPADRLLRGIGAEVSARGVARLYRELCHGFVIDERDAAQCQDVEAQGLACRATDTLMRTPEIAAALAATALELADAVGRRR